MINVWKLLKLYVKWLFIFIALIFISVPIIDFYFLIEYFLNK